MLSTMSEFQKIFSLDVEVESEEVIGEYKVFKTENVSRETLIEKIKL